VHPIEPFKHTFRGDNSLKAKSDDTGPAQ